MPGGTSAMLLVLAANAGGEAVDAGLIAAAGLGRQWGVVTSLRRTPAHNRAVGGVPNSHHLHGRAIDLARRAGVRHADVAAAFRKAGFVLIESLDEGDHSHFAFGPAGAARPRAAPEPLAVAAIDPRCSAAAANPLARRRPDRALDCQTAG